MTASAPSGVRVPAESAAPPAAPRSRRRPVAVALLVLGALVAVGVAVLRDDERGLTVFSEPLAPDVPLAAGSAENARRLAAQARYTPGTSPVAGYYPTGYNSIIQEGQYSVPVYTVGPDQPTARVTWIDEGGRPLPAGVAAGLQSTFDAVPVPTGVAQLQADGGDGHLVIHQPSTDTMWEFWVFSAQGGEYTARYGARIDDVSQSTGVLPHDWGARATSLALLGGVMRMEDYERGVFPYALAVGLPVIDEAVVPPATRSDGPGSATPSVSMEHALSEGMRFRLPADYRCDALPGEPSKLLTMLCAAARDYGLLVVDRTGGSLTLYAEDDRSVGTPYQSVTTSPWPAIEHEFGGPDAVLDRFPWEDLQQVAPPQRP